jgi:enoyl-CoA hydratase
MSSSPSGSAATPAGGSPTVAIEAVSEHVSIIRLNRPDRLNAINFPLVGDLHDALDTVSADPNVKVAVLTGAGRAFCAGLDLADFGMPPAPGEHPHMKRGIDGQAYMANLVRHIRSISTIVVAAVNGPAFGGGLGLACAADVRFAARDARMCSAYIRTGLTGTDIGISYTLPRLIGAARAFDLILSGREIDGVEAERMGLVSQAVESDALLDTAVAYANNLANYTHIGLSLTKEVLWHNIDAQSMDAAIAMENRNQNIAGQATEVRDYMAAYRSKITKK